MPIVKIKQADTHTHTYNQMPYLSGVTFIFRSLSCSPNWPTIPLIVLIPVEWPNTLNFGGIFKTYPRQTTTQSAVSELVCVCLSAVCVCRAWIIFVRILAHKADQTRALHLCTMMPFPLHWCSVLLLLIPTQWFEYEHFTFPYWHVHKHWPFMHIKKKKYI